MSRQVLEGNEGECRSTEPARKPWSAPTLLVRQVDEITMGIKTTTKTDGSNYFS